MAVGTGPALVDEDEVLSAEILHESGCRIDDEAGTANDQCVCIGDEVNAPLNVFLFEAFFIEYNVRTYDAAAAAAGNTGSIFYEGHRIGFAAFHAVVAMNGAVQFNDVFGACHLVESVYILRDDGFEFSHLLELGKGVVAGIWFGIGIKHFLAIELVEFFRMIDEEAMGDHLFRAVFAAEFFLIDAVGTAEIRDAGFR